ncbi:hypothetical protein EB796_005745 [Bugula neritina]|uniref:C2H2-type domain-containing protein n=1 Tax=Bugula neritina TaxID=10212 RepID=A0A7J7KDE1_BUGNE|nr:hypothetical protein EB796_005745 [Bugula neritina]
MQQFFDVVPQGHECRVVKQEVSSNPWNCSLCLFQANQKKLLLKHCVEEHSRSWSSLVVKLRGEMKSLVYTCQHIEQYIPLSCKETACNIYVCYENTTPPTPSAVTVYRCTKCYKCFGSLDLEAGHRLLDHCNGLDSPHCKFGCSVCKAEFDHTEEMTSHYLRHHTVINSRNSNENFVDNSNTLTPGSNTSALAACTEDSRQFTEDALLMVEAMQKVGTNSLTSPSEESSAHMIQAKIVADFDLCCQGCDFYADHTSK